MPLRPFLLATLVIFSLCTPARPAHLGMGLRVGDVTGNSAVVWTRVTATAERNHEGFREPKKRSPRVDRYTPSPVAVAKRQGEITGAAGQVRLVLSVKGTRAPTS